MTLAVTVRAEKLNVNIAEELEPYLNHFDSAVVKEDKLLSCSPFREDRKPSFAVNLIDGLWIDSGGVGEYHKGGFVKLLAFLRNESAEATEDYLLELYSERNIETSSLKLDIKLKSSQVAPQIISNEQLQQYAYRSPYLSGRGISEHIQRKFRVGYCKDTQAVVMPHADKQGNIVNLKFRSVRHKKFWYGNGQPVKNHLYGLYQCLQEPHLESVVIVESEIDCMILWSHGIPAVAFGTAHMSVRQAKLLLSSGIPEFIIATDNDAAGKDCKEQVIKAFQGRRKIKQLIFPSTAVKDIGDMSSEQLSLLVTEEIKLNPVLK